MLALLAWERRRRNLCYNVDKSYSMLTPKYSVKRVSGWLAATNVNLHIRIRDNFARSNSMKATPNWKLYSAGARNTELNTGDRDSNPRSVFTIPRFRIGELLSPGSRNPYAISQMIVKYRYYYI